jgi:hypothetical protein
VSDRIDIIEIVHAEKASQGRWPWYRYLITIEEALVNQKTEDLFPSHGIDRRRFHQAGVDVVIDKSYMGRQPPAPPTPPMPAEVVGYPDENARSFGGLGEVVDHIGSIRRWRFNV